MENQSVYERIGKRIRHYRLAKHITQAMLAEQMAVTTPYISKLENGVCKLTLSMAKDAYSRFNWDIDFIISSRHYKEQPFAGLLRECDEGERQKIIDLIVWALKITLEKHSECSEKQKKKYIACLNLVSSLQEFNAQGSSYICEDRILYGIRKENKLSETDMAKSLSINDRQYYNLEAGQTKARMDVLIRLGSDYGINPSFFVTGKFEQMTIVNEIWDMLTEDEKNKVMAYIDAGRAL